jgi:hypothetical protein
LEKISNEKNPGLYQVLTAISNTINFKPGADSKISLAFGNEDFKEFMKNLKIDTKLSTYELF